MKTNLLGTQPIKNVHTYATARHLPKGQPINNKCKLRLAMKK